MQSIYDAIMNPDVNPLKRLPPAQRFQLMSSLGMMWTAIFCAATSTWYWYGELVVVHVIVAMGFLITGMTFQRASRKATVLGTMTYRDHRTLDGTARYDDVWGA